MLVYVNDFEVYWKHTTHSDAYNVTCITSAPKICPWKHFSVPWYMTLECKLNIQFQLRSPNPWIQFFCLEIQSIQLNCTPVFRWLDFITMKRSYTWPYTHFRHYNRIRSWPPINSIILRSLWQSSGLLRGVRTELGTIGNMNILFMDHRNEDSRNRDLPLVSHLDDPTITTRIGVPCDVSPDNIGSKYASLSNTVEVFTLL